MRLYCLFLLPLAILFTGLLTLHAEETPRSAMRKGLKAYRKGDYTNAVGLLEKTVLEFPSTGHYNLGNAHYRNGDFEAAEEAYNEALRTTDLTLQAKAYFNRGNALLARITLMTDSKQIAQAIEWAFEASDMYEKTILFTPSDFEAKCNYEKAFQLRLKLEDTMGMGLYYQAESLLKEYKAKDARANFRLAKEQFEHILADLNPGQNQATQYLKNTNDRLAMLTRALETTEKNLQLALQQINDYQYILAAQRLTTETEDWKYAFDLKPDLKKSYEETTQKNKEVLEIIKKLSQLNLGE